MYLYIIDLDNKNNLYFGRKDTYIGKLTFNEAWFLYKSGYFYDKSGLLEKEVKYRRTGEKD